MVKLLLSILLTLLLSYANALITFKDVDNLAVITTSCFKTISRHDASESPSVSFQEVALLEKNINDLETVGF
jgi:hypothetical protein